MTPAQKAARIAFITNRRNAEVIPRITANAAERNSEYELRFQVLDSLVNQGHGVGKLEANLQRVVGFLTEQKSFFGNFVEIYKAVTKV
jgi:hypothetical protein